MFSDGRMQWAYSWCGDIAVLQFPHLPGWRSVGHGWSKGVNPLAQMLCESAGLFLARAIELEFESFLGRFVHLREGDGLHTVVRNGYQPERRLRTGIGQVSVRVPKVRCRSGEHVAFHSALVPPYLRGAPKAEISQASVGEYLGAVVHGACGGALSAILGAGAGHVPPSLARELQALWLKCCDESLKGKLAGLFWTTAYFDAFEVEREAYPGSDIQSVLVAFAMCGSAGARLLSVRARSGNACEDWRDVLIDLKSRGMVWPSGVEPGRRAFGFHQAWRDVMPVPARPKLGGFIPGALGGVQPLVEVGLGARAPLRQCLACGGGPGQCARHPLADGTVSLRTSRE